MSADAGKPGDGACPACGGPAGCALTTGEAACWCFELPPVMPMPPAGTGARCYCRKCLEALIAAGGGAPRPSRERGAAGIQAKRDVVGRG
jgi:hypothetical protein